MKWIGQHIYDLVSRFRNDVYLEDISTSTETDMLVVDSEGKVGKRAIDAITVDVSDFMTNGADNYVLTATGADAMNAEANLTFDGSTLTLTGDLAVTGDTVTFQSTSADDPMLKLLNTTNDDEGARLIIQKMRADDAVASGQNVGEIVFRGQDDGQADEDYAQIVAEIDVSTHGQESGKVTHSVAAHDGGNHAGLILQGGSESGEVDATIAKGANSLTTVAGTLTMGSTATLNNSGVIQVAAQTVIDHDQLANYAANEHFTQANITTVGTISSGTWQGTAIANAYLDSDTMHLSVAQTITGEKTIDTNDKLYFRDTNSYINSPSANDLEIVATDIVLDAAGDITLEAAGGDVTITEGGAPPGGSSKPQLKLQSIIDDATAAYITFDKNRFLGGEEAGTANGDDLGTIQWTGTNNAAEFITYASMVAEISEVADTDEAGKLTFYVAASDGTTTALSPGLILEGEHATSGEVDVVLGKGDFCTTYVSGNLTVSPSGKLTARNRTFAVSTSTDGDYSGDVVYFGGTTSMTTGAIYHYKSDGTWELADADAASTSDGLLGVALGAASDTNGVLLRGMVTLDHDPGAIGDVLYLSTTGGDCSATAPSGNGDIVRIIGYQVSHASNGNIWFNPDGTFVEISA